MISHQTLTLVGTFHLLFAYSVTVFLRLFFFKYFFLVSLKPFPQNMTEKNCKIVLTDFGTVRNSSDDALDGKASSGSPHWTVVIKLPRLGGIKVKHINSDLCWVGNNNDPLLNTAKECFVKMADWKYEHRCESEWSEVWRFFLPIFQSTSDGKSSPKSTICLSVVWKNICFYITDTDMISVVHNSFREPQFFPENLPWRRSAWFSNPTVHLCLQVADR